MKRVVLFCFIMLLSSNVFSQLSRKHWIPPLHARTNNLVEDHYLYLSTPVTTPFQVTVTQGDGTPFPGSPFTISNANPVTIFIGGAQPSPMFVNSNELNEPTVKGLILEGTRDFYASFRVRSTNHAEILVSKGNTAKGTSFRVGSLPQSYDSTIRNFVTSFMATEDNTSVSVSDYNPNVVFLTSSGNLSVPTQNFILNAGESVVLTGNTNNPVNYAGFIGALINSDKPIVVNTGNIAGGMGPSPGGTSSLQDINLDQIVPVDKVGSEYIIVRGNGSVNSEFPMVIATEDNTEVFVNGNPTPIFTLNAGEYDLIPNSNYIAGSSPSMYVTSSKPVYMYQILAGDVSDATSGLNFIPPLSCFFQKSVDLIPDVDVVGGTQYQSVLFIITTAGSTITINGNTTTAIPQIAEGNPNWVTYKVPNISGNVAVVSTGPLAVGVFGFSGVAGFAGYYSGFGSEPEDSETIVCTNAITDLLERFPGNPETGGTWTVPAGAPALNGNLFDPAVNVPGLYSYSFSIICDGEELTTDIALLVSVEEGPNAGISSAVAYCTTDPEIDLATLLGANVTAGGSWTFNGVSRPNGVFNPAADAAGVYAYTIAATPVCEAVVAEITVSITPSPSLTTVTPFELCDDIVPSDTDGLSFFDLTTKETEILNNQTGTVRFYLDQNDANVNNSNTITSVTAATNTTVYYSITNASGCFSVGSFSLVVHPVPAIPLELTIRQCDSDTDGVTVFNLNDINEVLIANTNGLTFTYHSSEQGAFDDTALVTNPTTFTAASGTEVWARVVTSLGCIRVAKIELIVSATTIPNDFQITLTACDDFIDEADPSNDGFAYFDFVNGAQNVEATILGLFANSQDLTVAFYTNELDALTEQNPITDITNYRNETPNAQQIWVRVDSALNNECFGSGPYLNLVVHPIPELSFENELLFICVDAQTGIGSQIVDATPITPGNYSYQWTPANPIGDSPFYEINQEGTYSVTVTNTVTNCSYTTTITADFSSEPASFSAEVVTPAFSSGTTTIEATAIGGFGTYEYSLNLVDWQMSPIFTDLPNGSYTVYVRDIQGCGVLESELLFAITYPNFFTPNGDGYNDTWNIANLDASYQAKIFIYDRYGKFLKQIDPLGAGWDGTFAGQLLPSTDYWFKIEYMENGMAKEFRAHFSLIR